MLNNTTYVDILQASRTLKYDNKIFYKPAWFDWLCGKYRNE